jgi:ubiquinone/menaquinone biosynthesis C-methylase UbiE
LNRLERWVVNNPVRVATQRMEMIWFLNRIPLRPGCRVMEFGCGRGAAARLILEKFKPSLVVAQDLDFTMIRKIRSILEAREKNRIAPAVADAYRMPFADNLFDAVFSFGVLHHVPDWQTAVSETARVLKPGGVYYIEELYPGSYQNAITAKLLVHPRENRFESDDLKKEMEKSGLVFRHILELKSIGLLGICVKQTRVG